MEDEDGGSWLRDQLRWCSFAFDPLGQGTDTLVDRLTDKGSKSNFGLNSIYSKVNFESVIGFSPFFSPFFSSFFFFFLLFSVFNKQQSQDAVMSNGSRVA